MTICKVTFKYEGDDPDDPTGLTSDSYDRLMDALMELGADDIDITKVREEEQ